MYQFDERTYVNRPNLEDPICKAIDDQVSHVHVAGEPGAGKTWLLDAIEKAYRDFEETEGIETNAIILREEVSNYHRPRRLHGLIGNLLFNELPESVKKEIASIKGLTISGTGIQFGSNEPEITQLRKEYHDILAEYSTKLPEIRTFVVCIDDVQNLSAEPSVVRTAIRDAANALQSNVVLVTLGHSSVDSADVQVEVSMFSEKQTHQLLSRSFEDIAKEGSKRIHTQLDGHPLLVGQLAESESAIHEGVPEVSDEMDLR